MLENFLTEYGKEIFAAFVPLIIWILDLTFRAKAKLEVAEPHTFTFIVDTPLLDQDGNQIHDKQSVHTRSVTVRNSGRETANNLELVFNWKPLCINVWPSRSYKVEIAPDDRYILKFDSLSPNETLGLEVMSLNQQLPELVTVRSDQCTGKFVAMYPQPVVSSRKRALAVTLMLLGMAAAVYLSTLLVQFLILRTLVFLTLC